MLRKVFCISLFICSLGAAADDTILKLYRPFGDVTNQAIPQVKNTLMGECYSQSQLIVREDAWRCLADGKTYDPCFVKSGPERTEALCPQSPWIGDSVLIKVKEPLHNEQNKTLDMALTYPWGIELTNGEHCMAINSGKIYDQMPVRYKCSSKNYLVGHLQRCKNVWSMLQKTPQGVVTVELKKAWF
ncbi:hypothetical protein [Legionella cherrii]|uniref:Uncharacterized protein n=1 Tax=Legionella cherrii TaxID=28084 RepID=A0A0W0SGH1_9GAMM|nr:hypothetical protein [Legionella cherrii]KTC82543.1 hypothetical protein Lche_0223 [Legionella cherrii]VEB35413.1 Uncharacterised protein [Legionella cherrii]